MTQEWGRRAGQGREQVGWGCLRGCCPKGSAGQRRTLPALGPAQSRSTLQWPSHDPLGSSSVMAALSGTFQGPEGRNCLPGCAPFSQRSAVGEGEHDLGPGPSMYLWPFLRANAGHAVPWKSQQSEAREHG